jgi:hypothetical protein
LRGCARSFSGLYCRENYDAIAYYECAPLHLKLAFSSRAMRRRMEDRIEKLCREFIAETDPEKASEFSGQLRTELHHFIQALRARVAHYPVVADRRAQTGVPIPALAVPETSSPIASLEVAPEVAGSSK